MPKYDTDTSMREDELMDKSVPKTGKLRSDSKLDVGNELQKKVYNAELMMTGTHQWAIDL